MATDLVWYAAGIQSFFFFSFFLSMEYTCSPFLSQHNVGSLMWFFLVMMVCRCVVKQLLFDSKLH